ncbi:alpha-ribazole phosphatase [Ekhidna sp.]
MEIYLIRHTTPDIPKEICYGQSNVKLASTFIDESRSTLANLPSSIDIVYTSPLERCLELAKLIVSKKLEEIPQLQEMSFGDWELMPWSDIPMKELNPWMENFVNEKVPNGESMKMLATRVIKIYKRILASKEEKIAIVTHAGPIRIILSEVNQTPLKEAFERYQVDYGEVIIINKKI